MNKTVSASESNHYSWGDGCDGWNLLKREDIGIIQERVPPGKFEVKHYHSRARQFFYILKGSAVMEFEDRSVRLGEREGLEINPGEIHQFRNESEADVEFLVISFPPTSDDRINVK